MLAEVARSACVLALLAALAVSVRTDLARRIIPNGCVCAVAAAGMVRACVDGGAAGAVWAALGGLTVAVFLLITLGVADWLAARRRGSGAPGEAAGAATTGAAHAGTAEVDGAEPASEPAPASGMGGGDLKLFSALGLWTGPVAGLALVGLACALALAGRAACALAARLRAYRQARNPGALGSSRRATTGQTGPLSTHNAVMLNTADGQTPAVRGIAMAPAIALAAITILLLMGIT